MSENIKREYRKVEGLPEGKELEISVYYDLGGMNYFTGGKNVRGYYISVTPVKRNEFSVSSMLGQGYKKLLVEVTRKSKKKEAEALKISEEVEKELIDAVIDKVVKGIW